MSLTEAYALLSFGFGTVFASAPFIVTGESGIVVVSSDPGLPGDEGKLNSAAALIPELCLSCFSSAEERIVEVFEGGGVVVGVVTAPLPPQPVLRFSAAQAPHEDKYAPALLPAAWTEACA